MWNLENTMDGLKTHSLAETALAKLLQQEGIGFFDFKLLQAGLTSSVALAQTLKATYDQIAVLGIGGSSLGTQALVEALGPQLIEDKKIVFFDNVDGKSFYRKLEACGSKTLWLIISKSGGTIETLSQAEFVDEYLQKKGRGTLASQSVAITEKKSNPLYDWAQKNKVACLEVPLSVGGRFSVLTPVGLFPAAFLGLPVEEILAGAEKVFREQLNIKALTSQFLASFERHEKTTYFFYYCDDLKYWGQWIQQLWAESLGKKHTLDQKQADDFSVPLACRGSTDQHSLLQQISEGNQRKFVCFLRVSDAENFGQPLSTSLFAETSPLMGQGLGRLLAAEAQATQQALEEQKVPSLTLQTDRLDGRSIGALIFTFEMVVAALGVAKNVNPFDQPGVERGKVLTRSILKQ